MSRECEAIGCKTATAPGKFMCLKHWRMVSIELQRTISDRYRALRNNYGFLSDVTYLQACVSAIDGIAKAEGVTGANPYQRHFVLAQRRAAQQAPARADRVDCGECPNVTSGCAEGHCIKRGRG